MYKILDLSTGEYLKVEKNFLFQEVEISPRLVSDFTTKELAERNLDIYLNKSLSRYRRIIRERFDIVEVE